MGMESTKAEVNFLNRIKQYPNKVHLALDGADMEGFEYFGCDIYTSKPGTKSPSMKNKLIQLGPKKGMKMLKMVASYMPKMMKGINESYKDAENVVKDLENGQVITTKDHPLMRSYPNHNLWNELTKYAWDTWKVKIGFTQMPDELIFKGKGVLYNYALVCIQEMDKEAINHAPEMEAADEVIRVYSTLGIAINDIANWLRDNYNINCHSNHPLGGLVNTIPLAVKAGMGYFGHNGLLITKEFGQRHRVAPIFIENKFFEYTDSDEHKWIADFCKTCRKCERNCPTGAIMSEKKVKDQVLEGIGNRTTSIDREKCFPYFNKTMGCAICIKVCPFSKADGTYDKLKKVMNMKKLSSEIPMK